MAFDLPSLSDERIVGTTQRGCPDERATRTLNRIDWVVIEKIHGASICFTFDGLTLHAGRRNAWLTRTDDVVTDQRILNRVTDVR